MSKYTENKSAYQIPSIKQTHEELHITSNIT